MTPAAGSVGQQSNGGGSQAREAPTPRTLIARSVGRRVLRSLFVLMVVTLFAYGLIWLVPGNPASTLAGEFPTPEEVKAVEEALGLDDPVPVQYGRWVTGALRGDLGESLQSGRSVSDEITVRLPVTASITLFAVVFGLLIAVPIGTLAAVKRGSLLDRALTVGSTVGVAMPSFFVAILLVVFVSLKTDFLPATGYVGPSESVVSWVRHCTLPGVALGLALAAELSRQIRSALVEVLQSDYIRTARAKGVPAWRVLTKHAYKNAAIPVVTILGAQVAALVGGTIIIEQIFALPGIGSMAITAVRGQDIPVVQAVVVVVGALVLLINTLVDISYGLLDPRTRR